MDRAFINRDTSMETIILIKPRELEYRNTELERTLREDEVLLKVHTVGICGTDMHAYRGKQPFFTYPRILGHELGAEVIQVGRGVSGLKSGDRCSVEPYFNYKEDQAVKRGKTNCGENISVFGVHEDGGMREFIKLPAKYLHKSSTLSYEQLALVETLGIGCHAVNRAGVQPEDLVLVIGAGPIGLAATQFARLKKARVAVMDVNEERLKFCQEQMKADSIINANSEDVHERIRKSFDGDLPTVVMDATGNPESMKNTLNYVAYGGKIVFVGLYQGDFTFFDPLFHKKEITLMASRNALPKDFEQIILLMEEGKIDTTPWITHRIPRDKLIETFASLLDPQMRVVKAIVEF